MKIISKFFMFLTASLLFITACKKKDDGLTAATQTGANTLSCLIDGKLFIPKNPLYLFPESLFTAHIIQKIKLYI